MPNRRQRARWRFGAAAGTFLAGVALYALVGGGNASTGWTRVTIVQGIAGSNQPDGADGVYTATVNGGLASVTGYEQGLKASLTLHVGTAPATVLLPSSGANLCNPEDVTLADMDNPADGALDVVVLCESGVQKLQIFFQPTPPSSDAVLLDGANWTRVIVAASNGRQGIMRGVGVNITGDSALELVVGEKEASGPCGPAGVAYYSSPTPRVAASWTRTLIEPAGWVNQLYVQDFDGDGELDIVYTDRERIDCLPDGTPSIDNTHQGANWLEGPTFARHLVTPPSQSNHEWFDIADWDGDGDLDMTDCYLPNGPLGDTSEMRIYINGGGALTWSSVTVPPPLNVGLCKHVTMYDIDGDTDLDLGVSSSHADAPKRAVYWLERTGTALAPAFVFHDVSGAIGAGSDVKFDNLLWRDCNGAGRLDALASEQHHPTGTGPGLGVVCYINPY